MAEETVELPEGFEADYSEGVLRIEGDSSEISKQLEHAQIIVETRDGFVSFSTESEREDIKSIVKAFRGHAENMAEGLEEKHEYRLKAVYAHFPMDVSVEDGEVVIENFMGERNPRRADILEGVSVEVQGEEVVVRGHDKEKTGQTAANIEQACRKGDRDPRSFQDGVYITQSP